MAGRRRSIGEIDHQRAVSGAAERVLSSGRHDSAKTKTAMNFTQTCRDKRISDNLVTPSGMRHASTSTGLREDLVNACLAYTLTCCGQPTFKSVFTLP